MFQFALKTSVCAAALAAVAFGGGQAQAAFTPVTPSAHGGHTHQQIFQNLYGGNWSASGVDFISDTGITATRVDDQDDQIISPDIYHAHAEAVFAGLAQSFGYLPGTDGGSYVNLFDVSGSGYAVSGSAVNIDLTAGPFRWARSGEGGTYSSLESDNPNGADHLVTYTLSGPGIPNGVTLLFFEDLQEPNADWDYNDLVVRVTVVPTPAAVAPGLMLLGALGLVRRRRNRNGGGVQRNGGGVQRIGGGITA